MQVNRVVAAVSLLLITKGVMAAEATATDAMEVPGSEAPQPVNDVLAMRVQQAIQPVADGTGSQVTAQVQNGSVLLLGTATSEDAVKQLIQVVASIPGVTEVNSQLTVKPT